MARTPVRHSRTPRKRRVSTTVPCRNKIAAQAAALIALLVEHCDVVVAAPDWKTKKSVPLFSVRRIVDGGTTINVAEAVAERVAETYAAECETMKEATARRRRPTRRIGEMFRICADVLAAHGIVVESAPAMSERVAHTSVVSIATPRGVLDAGAIAARGARVHGVLAELRGCVKVFHVPRGTPAVLDALFPPEN